MTGRTRLGGERSELHGTQTPLAPRHAAGMDVEIIRTGKDLRVPETTTVTVGDLNSVANWAMQHASVADQAKINAIIEAYARGKEQQFAHQPTVWEIDWFYRGSEKEFYRLALINSETLDELWGFS